MELMRSSTQQARECPTCGLTTFKRVFIDLFTDVYIECIECSYREMYDGEPLSMINDGIFN